MINTYKLKLSIYYVHMETEGTNMDYFEGNETVKQKLITAGIAEIEEHGISDFSLRRVASACNVSCAAPYKHFKDKEDFIAEIVLYIHNQWLMLQNQVALVFEDDVKKKLVETCVAYVRFWIANPNFRTVLMLKTDGFGDEKKSLMTQITDTTNELIYACCDKYNIPKEEEQNKVFIIRSLIYGATLMIDSGELENTKDTIDMIRQSIEKEF